MITRKQKEEIVAQLTDKLSSAEFMGAVNFHKLSVALATQLRRSLRAEGAKYVVAKKTLIGVAAKQAGIAIEAKQLEGEVALVFGRDAVKTAKTLVQFSKKHKDVFQILGGIWSKTWIDASRVLTLATIPPREMLLAQIAQLLQAPMRNLARVLSAPSRNLAVVLGQISTRK